MSEGPGAPALAVEVAAEPPVVAATWQSRAPAVPWCPPELVAHLGAELAWLADVEACDVATDAREEAGAWRAIGASRRGRVHAHDGAHREDAFVLARADDVTIAVASDGAGSSAWSRVGAEVACRLTARAALSTIARDGRRDGAALGAALTDGVRAACDALRALAARAGADPRAFRCTVLAAAVHDDGTSGTLAAVQVGDGAVAVAGADGSVRVVGRGDAGAYSGEVGCFVPDACADARAGEVAVMPLGDAAAVLVATDGVEDAFYPVPRVWPALLASLAGAAAPVDGFQHVPAPGPVIGLTAPAPAEAAARLGAWLAFEKRGENDDRTLLVLERRPPGG